MKKSEVNEEITLTNKLIQINKDKIKDLEEKENTIQERYKKMMEEELAGIIREKTERLATIETLEKMLSKDDVSSVDVKGEEKPVEVVEHPTPEPEQKTEEQPEDKKEEEPVIQDTLFPENNEPEQENETSSESSEQDDKDNNALESDHFQNDTNSGVDNQEIEEPVPTDDTSGFNFTDDNQQNSENNQPDDDNWASMPEEWQ